MDFDMTDCRSDYGENDEAFSEGELDEMEKDREETADYDYESDGDMTEGCMAMFFGKVSKVPMLTAEEEAVLAKRKDEGDAEATDRLAEANFRLVISIAKRYRGYGVEFPDLIQEGMIGLMKGIQKFDYRKGYRVSTFATWYIRQACAKAVRDYGRSIRIPAYMLDRLYRFNREKQKLTVELGHEPDEWTVAESMGMKRREAADIMTLPETGSSLDAPVGEDGDMVIGDMVMDWRSIPMELRLEEADTREEVRMLLGCLPDREREVIMLRFGFTDGEAHTLETVGDIYGISKERVRQIETAAIRTLRKAAREKLAS